MRGLIAKEWRENRALVIGFLVITPLLSLGLKYGILGEEKPDPEPSIVIFIPAMLGLFLISIACDLVAADVSTGRVEHIFSLPVRPTTVWAAKVAFLTASAAAYFGYLLAVEEVVLSFGGRSLTEIFGQPWNYRTTSFAIALVTGAAALCFSTLLDRGIAAACAAVLLVSGIVVLVTLADPTDLNAYRTVEPFTVRIAAATIVGGLALGSLLAFSRGRIHLGSRLRRIGLAAAAVPIALLPTAVWAGTEWADWEDCHPADDDCYMYPYAFSPDLSQTLVFVQRSKPDPLGLGWTVLQYRPQGFWIFSLRDGTATPVEDEDRPAWAKGKPSEPRPPVGYGRKLPPDTWGWLTSGTQDGTLIAVSRQFRNRMRCLYRVPGDGGPPEVIHESRFQSYAALRDRTFGVFVLDGRLWSLEAPDFEPRPFDGDVIEGPWCIVLCHSGLDIVSVTNRSRTKIWRAFVGERRVELCRGVPEGSRLVRMTRDTLVLLDRRGHAFEFVDADGNLRRVEPRR